MKKLVIIAFITLIAGLNASAQTEKEKIKNGHGIGRELFGSMRNNVLSAEEGAITWIN